MMIIPIILTLGPAMIFQFVQYLWGRRTTAFHCLCTIGLFGDRDRLCVGYCGKGRTGVYAWAGAY